MSQVSVYLRERFPLAAVITLAVGTGAMLSAASSRSGFAIDKLAFAGLMALAFTAFLLRQRVMDEFKDRGHDNSNYPNRPVQRGAITVPTLIWLGAFAFGLEVATVGLLAVIGNPASALAYLGVIAFSLLTAFEFFAPEWLNKHFNIYFASHQLIFAFFWLWAITVFDQSITLPLAASGLAFILGMAAIEVMRKFEIRKNTAGEVVADTYLAVWGRLGSVGFIAASFVFAGGLFALSRGPMLAAAGIVAALVVVLVRHHNKAVQAATIGGFYLVALVAFFL